MAFQIEVVNPSTATKFHGQKRGGHREEITTLPKIRNNCRRAALYITPVLSSASRRLAADKVTL